MDKNTLRKTAKGRAGQMTKEVRAAVSDVIAERLISSSLFRESHIVFCYVSVSGEVDTKKVIESALETGKTVCVPRCGKDGQMDAVVIRSLLDLTGPTFHGVPQPDRFARVIEPQAIDLVIVPCLGAGKNGARLGHGGGYYDRFLAKCCGNFVCLCFDDLVFPDVPTESHDVAMHYLITEKGWFTP